MPSTSKSQRRLMAASCTGQSDAVPKDVACEFMHSDKDKVKDMPERLGQFSGRKKEKGKLERMRSGRG
jgi:hypothetical protein